MKFLSVFLEEFGPPSIGVTVGMLLVWWLGRRVPSVNASAFPELRALSKDEQRRLLHEANALAFHDWRSFIPFMASGLLLTVGLALSQALSQATTALDSPWARAGVAAGFGGFGGWLAGRLAIHHLRPFLRACLEGEGHAS